MGGCLVGRSYPGKTLEQARKQWSLDCEQSRYEDGHSYSGEIGMLNDGQLTGRVFNSGEEFDEFLEGKYKGDAFWAQIRVIRETKPLIAARQARHTMYWDAYQAKEFGQVRDPKKPGTWKKGTAAQLKRVADKFAKLDAKYQTLLKAQVEKSTKTTWAVGGIASS